MSAQTLHSDLKKATLTLLDLAKELTWNEFSDNCKFILTKIEDSEENFHEQRRLNKIENDKKTPLDLEKLLPALLRLYSNIYDINLHIYRATKDVSIIDIRYYPKSSLEENYRKQIINDSPMIHCKVANPPWLSDNKEKFDINWEHN